MRQMTIFLTMAISVLVLQSAGHTAAEQESSWRERRSALEQDTRSEERLRREDLAEEIDFGREVAARVIGRHGLYRDPGVTRYVILVGRTVALHANRPELEFRFGVLDTDQINAYAAPGGYVFVTRGALARMQDESELAGVIAHEISHVVERHVMKELNIQGPEGSAVSGFARLIGGGTESARVAFFQTVDKAMDILFKDGYTREDEAQADQDSVILCAHAGYDPGGLARYFSRLNAAKGKQTEVLDKTHPSYGARIAALSSIMSREGIAGETLKTSKQRFATAMKNL
jgi:predicted Zn-dependent protease